MFNTTSMMLQKSVLHHMYSKNINRKYGSYKHRFVMSLRQEVFHFGHCHTHYINNNQITKE